MVLLTQGSECKRPIALMSKDINYPLFTANLSCHWGLGAWRLAEHGLQGRTVTLSFMRNHKCFDWEIILCASESGGLIPLRPGCCPTACSCVCTRSCVCIVTAHTLFVWWLHGDETAFLDEFLVFMIYLCVRRRKQEIRRLNKFSEKQLKRPRIYDTSEWRER